MVFGNRSNAKNGITPPPSLGGSTPPVVENVIQPAQAEEPAKTLSSISQEEQEKASSLIKSISDTYSKKVVGQAELRESLLVSLLAGGHLLLESVPGLAKTTAAHTLASTISASFKRVQCTPDLLPSDIVGTQIYDQHTGSFKTELGPVHANFVLLDEINRSSAKTQSAMLEAMQERQTSIGGKIYPLPDPFLVIATQNPIEQEGTYHLPEAQLDRFLLKEVVSYSSPSEELEVLNRVNDGTLKLNNTESKHVASLDDVRFLQGVTSKVYVDTAIRQYIINLVVATRNPKGYVPEAFEGLIEYGGSPRASIAFLQASKALALLNGRTHVIPEDIKALAHRVLRHRLILNFEAEIQGIKPETIIDALLTAVPTP